MSRKIPMFAFARILLVLAALQLSLPGSSALAREKVLNGLESSITVYSYPPRHAIDWSSPQRALMGFFGNLLRIVIAMNKKVKFQNDHGEAETMSTRVKSSMGHSMMHIRCTLPSGEVYDRWSSLSGQDYMEVDKLILIKEKQGLGAMFYDYVDGHIITGLGNVNRLTYYKGKILNGERIRPRYIQFEIGAVHCAKVKDMVTFFESFHFRHGTPLAELEKRDPEKLLYFTNNMDPYDSYMERMSRGKGKVGGGCAPYAVALLKLSDRFHPAFEKLWKTDIKVSEKLIGGIEDEETGDLRRVSLRKLLFSRLGSRWDYSDEGYKNRHLSLFDPQKIWDFTGSAVACLKKAEGCRASTKALLASEKNFVGRGQTRVFRGRNAGGNPIEQRVEGFVWRMR